VGAVQRMIAMSQIKAAVDGVLNLTEADRGTNKIPLGNLYPAFATYWLDLADYNPAEEMKNVSTPLLFLQGGHDYHVTEVDFNLFKTALEGRDNAKFILYPDLTHAFTFTPQFGTPADYMNESTVDEHVARDIAEFIKNN
jgi:fermentation-respiration switch protein FrsA (DUF1100 family)